MPRHTEVTVEIGQECGIPRYSHRAYRRQQHPSGGAEGLTPGLAHGWHLASARSRPAAVAERQVGAEAVHHLRAARHRGVEPVGDEEIDGRPSSYWVIGIRPGKNKIHRRRARPIRLVPMIAARTPGLPQLRGAAVSPEDVPEAVVAIVPSARTQALAHVEDEVAGGIGRPG